MLVQKCSLFLYKSLLGGFHEETWQLLEHVLYLSALESTLRIRQFCCHLQKLHLLSLIVSDSLLSFALLVFIIGNLISKLLNQLFLSRIHQKVDSILCLYWD